MEMLDRIASLDLVTLPALPSNRLQVVVDLEVLQFMFQQRRRAVAVLKLCLRDLYHETDSQMQGDTEAACQGLLREMGAPYR